MTATFPLASTGGATPDISITQPGATHIWYSNQFGVLTGDANFNRDIGNDRYTWTSTVNTSFGIKYNGTGAPLPLANVAGLGMDFQPPQPIIYLGWKGIGTGTRLEMSDANLRTDLFVQDFWIRGYNSNVAFFSEITATGVGLLIGDGSGVFGDTRLEISSQLASTQLIRAKVPGGIFDVTNSTGATKWLLIDTVGEDYAIGDLNGAGGSNLIWIEDDNDIISVRTIGTFQVTDPSNNQWFTVNPTLNTVFLGNISGAGNDTILSVHDSSKLIQAQTDSIFKVINVAGQRFLDTDMFNNRVRFGDIDNATTGTTLTVDYSGAEITSSINGQFLVKEEATGQIRFAVDTTNIIVAGGDTTLVNNGVRFALFDSLRTMDFACPAGVIRFGDPDTSGNGLIFSLDDILGRITSNRPIRLAGYTFATLPALPLQGDTAFITDALTPTALAPVVGGGAVVVPVFYDGTNWIVG